MRYGLNCQVSFFYMMMSQTHGLTFNNDLLKDPIKPYWMDYFTRLCDSYNKWMKFWLDAAANTDQIIYFFRFEDVIADPKKEITKIF